MHLAIRVKAAAKQGCYYAKCRATYIGVDASCKQKGVYQNSNARYPAKKMYFHDASRYFAKSTVPSLSCLQHS